MRCMLPIMALLVVALPVTGGAQESYVETEVGKLSKQITDSMVKGDTKVLEAIQSHDFIAVNPEGVIMTKAGQIKDIKEGTIRFEVMDRAETIVRVHGDTAVVTARVKTQVKFMGQEIGGSVRISDTYAS